jgi:hypothetical protein
LLTVNWLLIGAFRNSIGKKDYTKQPNDKQ